MSSPLPLSMIQAVLRLISVCPDPEALLIVADRLDAAAAEAVAGGGDAADLHELSAACRAQAAHLKEPK